MKNKKNFKICGIREMGRKKMGMKREILYKYYLLIETSYYLYSVYDGRTKKEIVLGKDEYNNDFCLKIVKKI